MLRQSRITAQILCNITDELLWQPRRQWALQKKPNVTLTMKVGNGHSTYMSHTDKHPHHKIVYGVLMVQNKSSSFDNLCSWTSTKEIIERKYFDGEMTMVNAMAAVACHEFAHFIQVLNGWVSNGSVHNDDFYRVLDKIHSSGTAEQVRRTLMLELERLGIELKTPKSISLEPNELLEFRKRFRPKQSVMFIDEHGDRVVGIITKVNKNTCKIKAGINSFMIYTVPKTKLHPGE